LFGQFREPAMQSLHVNGTDMAYLEVGDGPPLVCVHGSLGDFRIWSAVLGPPSKKHRGQAEIRGAAAVAETFKSRAQAAKPHDRRRQDRRDRGGRRSRTARPLRPDGSQPVRRKVNLGGQR
jgi:hypothetical protein